MEPQDSDVMEAADAEVADVEAAMETGAKRTLLE